MGSEISISPKTKEKSIIGRASFNASDERIRSCIRIQRGSTALFVRIYETILYFCYRGDINTLKLKLPVLWNYGRILEYKNVTCQGTPAIFVAHAKVKFKCIPTPGFGIYSQSFLFLIKPPSKYLYSKILSQLICCHLADKYLFATTD